MKHYKNMLDSLM